jgi:hypothetical protein
MGYQTGMIIDEGDKVALLHPVSDFYHRAMHHIALPHVVGMLRLVPATFFRLPSVSPHKVVTV